MSSAMTGHRKNAPDQPRNEEGNVAVKRMWIVAVGVMLCCQTPDLAFGETPSGTVIRDDISKTMDVDKNVQQMKTEWSMESRDLSDKLDMLTHQADDLEKTLEGLILRQRLEEEKYHENLRREKEADRVRSELSVYLEKVVTDLENAVAAELPFLTEERAGRL